MCLAWYPASLDSGRKVGAIQAEGTPDYLRISKSCRETPEQGASDDPWSVILLTTIQIRDRLYTAEVLSLTSQILLLNPEYYTVWNDRRRILINGLFPPSNGHSGPTASVPSEAPSLSGVSQTVLSLIESDLRFVIPMLRKFPKCYWIWNHRLWLLQQATQRLPVHVARDLWQAELGLVGKMLALDNRNFLCWGYRRHVVEQLESPILGIATTDTRDGKPAGMSMVEEEFHYTTKMIQSNLSNFSAWHYRSKLAPRLLAEREADANARRAFLDDGRFNSAS